MINSGSFWLVLLGTVILYWLLPSRLRVGFLAAASFLYLATVDVRSLLALVPVSLGFYFLAPRTRANDRTSRYLLAGLILGILGYLAYFKYIPPLLKAFITNPISEQLLLPLGISYFTFKLIHYVLETSRGNIESHSMQQFLLYIFLFPIFTAGPIERFDHFQKNRDERLTREAVAEGLQRIIFGLIKKFFIAELILLPVLAEPSADQLIAGLDGYSPLRVWLHVACFFLFAYLDFSAYSDIAIGTSRLFGFRIMENFNFPILAPNISEFWNRWHMTLSGWCRTYIYMPTIGLTRNPYLAVYGTMAGIGLWHAGTLSWMFWGLYHATGIAAYGAWMRYRRKLKRLPGNNLFSRFSGVAITMAFVSGSYVFPMANEHGGLLVGFRLLAKLAWVDLPG